MSDIRSARFAVLGGLALLVGLGLSAAGPVGVRTRSDRGAAAVSDAPADPAWVGQVVRTIVESEYAFTLQEDGSFSAPNRAHGFRTFLRGDALELVPRSEEAGFSLSLTPSAWGRQDRLEPLDPASGFHVAHARATLSSAEVTVAVTNDERGLEQRFTVARAPIGSGPLLLELTLRGSVGASLEPGEGSVLFKDAHSGPVARLVNLVAVDAQGQPLPCRVRIKTGALQFEVGDAGAAYPVTVSAGLASSAWTFEGDQENAHFGVSAATAGDVDGDGHSDLLVGAYSYDNGQFNEGRAFLYRGSPAGPLPLPAWTAEGNQAASYFGWSVASAGDVNGDGFSDVLVGAHLYDNGQNTEGRAHLYLGSAAGLSPAPVWTIEGNQEFAYAGRTLAGIGDVNADGFSDVAIGMYTYDNGDLNEGRVLVFHGSPSGLSAPTNPQWTVEGNSYLAHYGGAVSGAGDVNGDGYADLIVGAYQLGDDQPFEGRAYVYLGSPSGLAVQPVWTVDGNQPVAQLGHSVARAGDVNGDGFSDILVGANLYDGGQLDEGRALLFLGSPNGPQASPEWTAEGDQDNAFFAHNLASAGDVNGDGYADVIVGAYQYDNEFVDEGRAYVYLGHPSGLRPRPVAVLDGGQTGASFGYSVGTAGDVNGDGYSDVIAGGFGYDNGLADEGTARIYPGSARGTSTTPIWLANGEVSGEEFAVIVASAGDVNGDGMADVVVGAPGFDEDRGRALFYLGTAVGLGALPDWIEEGAEAGARFGEAVASAGDVNGDGFTDLLIGAPGEDASQADAGKAFLYLGSSAGPGASPLSVVEGDQAGAALGRAVASAGDVNGDGYADVIVGAPTADRGQRDEGRAFLHLGSPAGLGGAVWSAEGDQPASRFGAALATAGDVNGDGFSDVLVGAPRYDNGLENEGRAFLYLGSAAGLGPAVWSATGGQTDAFFGTALARAGDLNGDGFSDVIVGASGFDTFQSDAGRAFVFFGSDVGLSAIPDWTASGQHAGDRFGTSVAPAGDVDNDGFSDVFVGAPFAGNPNTDPGWAYVYLGSASGLADERPLMVVGPQRFQNLGASGAGEGDVNGDGFSDLVLSAPGNGGGAGRVLLYMGGGGLGIARQVRQAESDGVGAIALLGNSDSANAFRLRATGHTPAGRARVRLELEVKPQGQAFDGLGSTLTAEQDTGYPGLGGSVFQGFDELVSGTVNGPHVWRLRILTKDPLFPRSPWLVMSGNAVTETDLRLPAAPRRSASFFSVRSPSVATTVAPEHVSW